MKNSISRLFFAVLTSCLLASCVEDDLLIKQDDKNIGKEILVNLNLNPVNLTIDSQTRSVPEGSVDECLNQDNIISNLVIIEYDENGKMIGSPRYYDDTEQLNAVSIVVPQDNAKYTVIAIANVGNKSIVSRLASISDIKNISGVTKIFRTENDAYVSITSNDGNVVSKLMMNGMTQIDKNSTSLDIDLFRNVAKFNVNITNDENSGVTIIGTRIRSLPSLISYTDQLVTECVPSGAQFFDLEFEKWPEMDGLPASSNHLLYYLPRNMQGSCESSIAYNKNKYAPVHATYLEILASDDSNGSTLRYRFYLGKNMKNDFNIEPNHLYELNIEIKSPGDPITDSRVEVFKAGLLSSSNSYILSLLNDLPSQPYYSIPIDRINYFWENTTKSDSRFLIHKETEWVAEVVWQDSDQDLFHFCNPDGSEISGSPHFYEGNGDNDYFTVRPTGKGTGNVVIGVRNKELDGEKDGYMWSWHLWITDYDPYYEGFISDDKYAFKVDGGYVHRYKTSNWEKYLPANQGYYIMDRNFGQNYAITKNDLIVSKNKITSPFYFFGRKDPIKRVDIPLYRYSKLIDQTSGIEKEVMETDAKGTSFIKRNLNQTLSLEDAVKHPNYDYSSASLNAWLDPNQVVYSSWLRLDWDTAYKKSLFDPSPEGWMIPLSLYAPSKEMADPDLLLNYNSSSWFVVKLNPDLSYEDDNLAFFPRLGVQTGGGIAVENNACYIIKDDINMGSSYFWIFTLSGNNSLMISPTGTYSRKWGGCLRLIRDKTDDCSPIRR